VSWRHSRFCRRNSRRSGCRFEAFAAIRSAAARSARPLRLFLRGRSECVKALSPTRFRRPAGENRPAAILREVRFFNYQNYARTGNDAEAFERRCEGTLDMLSTDPEHAAKLKWNAGADAFKSSAGKANRTHWDLLPGSKRATMLATEGSPGRYGAMRSIARKLDDFFRPKLAWHEVATRSVASALQRSLRTVPGTCNSRSACHATRAASTTCNEEMAKSVRHRSQRFGAKRALKLIFPRDRSETEIEEIASRCSVGLKGEPVPTSPRQLTRRCCG